MKDNLIISDISHEMRTRYIDYAMSVIIGRALPDVRDGLKPVHRRIIYSMYELNLLPEKGYKKCARIVGDTLGKYHPHGDLSVYGALVRMAQDFSMRYVLIDGHGNYGSIDGDGASAMRYTEAKMNQSTLLILKDIQKNTVDFVPNFDGDESEPSVLPSRFPNLLANGSDGIAVGMSTSIPSHNLTELIDGILFLIDNENAEIKEIVKFVKAPDFPTNATIINPDSMLEMYEKGSGKIIIRSKYHVECNTKNTKSIVFTEIPYQVNKAKVCEHISELVCSKDNVLKNVTDIRDESDRTGIRIVVDVKASTDENIVIAYLFKKTKLQDNYNAIFRAIVNNEPKILNLKEILIHYIRFQEEIITKRSNFDLEKASERLHILNGLVEALNKLDMTINLIRDSKNINIAKDKLMEGLKVDEKQAKAILDLKLHKLTNLDKDNILTELNELNNLCEGLKKIINDKNELKNILKKELLEIREKFGDKRRTELIYNKEVENVIANTFTEDYSTTIVFTQEQYIKKTLRYAEKERQKVKDNDSVQSIIQTTNRGEIILISSTGNAHKLNISEIEEKQPSQIGLYLPSLLQLDKDEKIIGMLSTNYTTPQYVLIVFEDGKAVKIPLTSYMTKQNRSKLANSLSLESPVISIIQISDNTDIYIESNQGKAIVFNTSVLNEKKARNSQGSTIIKSNKEGFAVIKSEVFTDQVIKEDYLVDKASAGKLL